MAGGARVRFAEVLQEVSRPEPVDPNQKYRLLGVRWYGKGLFAKAEISGAHIKARTLYRVEPGDFIYNRLFAWKGSFGLAGTDSSTTYVSNEFPCFKIATDRLMPDYLRWFCSQEMFWSMVTAISTGSSRQSRLRLKEERFLKMELPLPPLTEQKLVSDRLTRVERGVNIATSLSEQWNEDQTDLLLSLVSGICKDAPRSSLAEVAPIIRRKAEIEKDSEYPELGIRSFGKGTFHKPAIKGSELGSKRLYRIEPGDLLFSNVFAWEGAIAIAQPEDKNRFGSHRFITCLPDQSKALAEYLRTWFLSAEGMAEIRAASPGAAGRNKTLNLKKLQTIQVPIPDMPKQRRFADVFARVQAARKLNQQTADELEATMPAALEQAFGGSL